MRPSSLLLAGVLAGAVACNNEAIDRLNAPRVLGGAHFSAVAAATQTEFAGFVNFCWSADPSNFKIVGSTLHFTGANQNRWVTGNPLIDGAEQNAVLFNLNLKNGNGAAHLDVTLKPDAVDGTWEIRQTLTFRDGVPIGSSGVGHGTGDLTGMTIKFATQPAVPVESVCNPDMPKAPVSGVILSPASNS